MLTARFLPIIAVLLSSATNAFATLALRNASKGTLPIKIPFTGFETSAWYAFAILLYFAAFVSYALVLRYLAPQIAYPIIVGLAYAFIVVLAATIFADSLRPAQVLGGMIVVLGIIIMSWAAE